MPMIYGSIHTYIHPYKYIYSTPSMRKGRCEPSKTAISHNSTHPHQLHPTHIQTRQVISQQRSDIIAQQCTRTLHTLFSRFWVVCTATIVLNDVECRNLDNYCQTGILTHIHTSIYISYIQICIQSKLQLPLAFKSFCISHESMSAPKKSHTLSLSIFLCTYICTHVYIYST